MERPRMGTERVARRGRRSDDSKSRRPAWRPTECGLVPVLAAMAAECGPGDDRRRACLDRAVADLERGAVAVLLDVPRRVQ